MSSGVEARDVAQCRTSPGLVVGGEGVAGRVGDTCCAMRVALAARAAERSPHPPLSGREREEGGGSSLLPGPPVPPALRSTCRRPGQRALPPSPPHPQAGRTAAFNGIAPRLAPRHHRSTALIVAHRYRVAHCYRIKTSAYHRPSSLCLHPGSPPCPPPPCPLLSSPPPPPPTSQAFPSHPLSLPPLSWGGRGGGGGG